MTEQSNNLLMASEYKNLLLKWLKTPQPVTVIFTKRDGTERTMRCTRNVELFGEEYIPKGTREDDPNSLVVRAFDLDKQAWRSISCDRIVSIDYYPNLKTTLVDERDRAYCNTTVFSTAAYFNAE